MSGVTNVAIWMDDADARLEERRFVGGLRAHAAAEDRGGGGGEEECRDR
jgi:hypothetical protein